MQEDDEDVRRDRAFPHGDHETDARSIACPGCGRVHDLRDMMDDYPPIPVSAWPERWSLVDEDRTLFECECGVLAEDIVAGLPPYPWDATA